MTRAGRSLALLVALGCGGSEPPPAAVSRVRDLAGAGVDPFADADARAVVLVFVSTSCPISNRYAPTLRRLAARFHDQGVATWLVYPDPDDGAAEIARHRADFELDVPALLDPAHELVARAQVRVTPEAAVLVAGQRVYGGRIDDRVRALGKIREQASSHELRDAVDAVVRGQAPAVATAPAIGCTISDLR